LWSQDQTPICRAQGGSRRGNGGPAVQGRGIMGVDELDRLPKSINRRNPGIHHSQYHVHVQNHVCTYVSEQPCLLHELCPFKFWIVICRFSPVISLKTPPPKYSVLIPNNRTVLILLPTSHTLATCPWLDFLTFAFCSLKRNSSQGTHAIDFL